MFTPFLKLVVALINYKKRARAAEKVGLGLNAL